MRLILVPVLKIPNQAKPNTEQQSKWYIALKNRKHVFNTTRTSTTFIFIGINTQIMTGANLGAHNQPKFFIHMNSDRNLLYLKEQLWTPHQHPKETGITLNKCKWCRYTKKTKKWWNQGRHSKNCQKDSTTDRLLKLMMQISKIAILPSQAQESKGTTKPA